MPPSKSPAKTRPSPAAAGTPLRRTPRSHKSPSRLGYTDNWGSTTPHLWVSETVTTRHEREEAKLKEREAFVSKLNAESENADESESKDKSSAFISKLIEVGSKVAPPPSVLESYKKMMTGYMWPATILQSVVLSVLGFVICQLIKQEKISLQESGQWAGWGVISAVVSLPYLLWLSKRTFGSTPKLDAALKALFNQAAFSQVLNVLFLSYWALLLDKDPVVEIKAGMLDQATLCFSFWLPSDLISMYLIPIHGQMLWNACLGVAWSAILAYKYS